MFSDTIDAGLNTVVFEPTSVAVMFGDRIATRLSSGTATLRSFVTASRYV